ncbi:protein FAM184B [Osmerus eperlanus]|uniref:protein FAM184B n=1 Tax=Osmerus eperlanus TaxID=29151 RepID=UPI002E109EAF
MASGAGKAAQPPGPSAVNGTAAEFQNIEQELYDYQMHSKMCKKIAQLTKVIYSLNTKNEEQEAALQSLSHAHQDTLHRVAVETCQEGEESALRTRLLELQESLDEHQRIGSQVQADFDSYRAQAEERERGAEAELRRVYEEKLQDAEAERQEAQSKVIAAQEEGLRLGAELEKGGEQTRCLEAQCEELRRTLEEERRKGIEERHRGEEERKQRDEERKKGEEEKRTGEKEMEKSLLLSQEVEALRKEKECADEERKKAAREEREGWERRTREMEEEMAQMRKRMEEARREERRQWEEREEEEKRGMHTALRERVRRAEEEVETQLQRLMESKRQAVKLQEKIQDLEEELGLGRKRVSEAEGGAKRAEEELAVAKERLLLQEDELQHKAEELLSRGGCELCVCAEVEELKGHLNRLQSRNRELELQGSGRNNDHARQIRQHAEALASLRSEMVRAQGEELGRVRKHAEEEKERLQADMEEERERLRKERETEKEQLQREKTEREKLQAEWTAERGRLLKEMEDVKERLRREGEEERERLRKEREVEKVRLRMQLDGNKERVDEERASLQRRVEEEKKRLREQAEEDKKRLKDQVRRAIEEVMRRHAAELHSAQEALHAERKRGQEVCERLEVERIRNEEVRQALEREREDLQTQLQKTTNEIFRSAIQQQENQGGKAGETPPLCGPHCSRLQEDLQHTQSRLAQTKGEAERLRERNQREISALRKDKHRLEEKVLEQSRQNTERNLLEQSQQNTEERIRVDCEERLRAEFKVELDAAVAEGNQQSQSREEELQTQISNLQTQLADLKLQVEKKRVGSGDDCHGNPEIDRLRKEVQETMEMNKRLREQLQEEPQTHSLAAERHARALQALERQAQEDIQAERNRLQTLHHLQLDKQRAELTQQHTEWSRQMTQRHMQQIEDLQAELQTHTQMMALQQDLKQQNQCQVFERQLDESHSAVLELQRENATLREQLKDRSGQEEGGGQQDEESEEAQRRRDVRIRDEAQRLREEVERLKEEIEKLEESHKQREATREEEGHRGEAEEKRKEEEEEERRRRGQLEELRREHRKEMQTLVSEYSDAQTHLQSRIVALETELREREERCRRKEPRCEDLQLGRLQEKLAERDQLIKRLMEERHQQQLHPLVTGDNSSPRIHDNKPRPGSVTPTTRRRRLEESPTRINSSPSSSPSLPRHNSSTLPHPSSASSAPAHSSALPYASSSLPHRHASASLPQHSSPSLPRTFTRSLGPEHGRSHATRTCTPLTPAPTAPLPVCPSAQSGIRYVSSSSQEPRSHQHSQPTRGPYLEPRGSGSGPESGDPQRQEWFTKYFSF